MLFKPACFVQKTKSQRMSLEFCKEVFKAFYKLTAIAFLSMGCYT